MLGLGWIAVAFVAGVLLSTWVKNLPSILWADIKGLFTKAATTVSVSAVHPPGTPPPVAEVKPPEVHPA